MFLVSEERLSHYAPPIRILMLGAAILITFSIFYYTLFDIFYKIVFTDEPRVPADYAGFCISLACLFVIASTSVRFIKHCATLARNKLK